MPRLLFLGGSRYLRPAIAAARAHGYRVITCDYLPGNYAHGLADEYHNVSVTDRAAVLALARNRRVDGILSFATDPGVVTAAYAAEKLGLPTCPYAAVSLLQDKTRFRGFLVGHGFRTPWFAVVEPGGALPAGDLPWPVIAKPADLAGSKGVTRVDDPAGLAPAVQRAATASFSGRVIVEEFLAPLGQPSDADAFSAAGKLAVASFSDQYFDPAAAGPFVPAGFSFPSTMPAAAQAELAAELQRLIRLLGLTTTLYNVETRVAAKNGAAYLMEVSPRAGGNRLAEVLRLATGVDLIDAAVRAAVGDPFDPPRPPERIDPVAEIILHAPRAGTFRRVSLDSAVTPRVAELDLWVAPGEPVAAFRSAADALGTLILRADTPAELADLMATRDTWLQVEVA